MVRTSTRGPPSSAVTALVASMPSSAASGRPSARRPAGSRPTIADRLRPVGGLADHLDVRFDGQDHPHPRADQRLVVGQHHADHVGRPFERRPASCDSRSSSAYGRRAVTAKPPPGAGRRRRDRPRPRRARGCRSVRGRPWPRCRRIGPRPSSRTLTVSSWAAYDDGDLCAGCRSRVLDDVGQGLLHDPVGREIDARRCCGGRRPGRRARRRVRPSATWSSSGPGSRGWAGVPRGPRRRARCRAAPPAGGACRRALRCSSARSHRGLVVLRRRRARVRRGRRGPASR